jgi:rubrerythrin
MELKSVDEILDYAINSEQEAHDFYTDLAKRTRDNSIIEMFEGFAREELGHKRKLERFKAGEVVLISNAKVLDLKIADMVDDIEPHDEISLQEALIVAMKREKSAFALYTKLADATEDLSAREVLRALAQEEAKHKLRFEIEYDEMILNEN